MSDAARAGLSPKATRRIEAVEAAVTTIAAVLDRADLPRRLTAIAALLLLPALLGYAMGEQVIWERAAPIDAPVSPTRQAFTDLFLSAGVLLDRAAAVPSTTLWVMLFWATIATVMVLVRHIVNAARPTWTALSMLHDCTRCMTKGFLAVPVLLLTYTQVADADLHPVYLIVGGTAAVAYLFAPGGAITSALIARMQVRAGR